MSGRIDVSNITAISKSSQMPDKQIQLELSLPEGQQVSVSYRRDLTVGYGKLQIEEKYNLPHEQQEWELVGVGLMSDPLSLSDFPSLANSGKGQVKVKLAEVDQNSEE